MTEHDILRKQLEEDVERFLANGGTIKQIDICERAYSAVHREDRRTRGLTSHEIDDALGEP